MRVQRQVLPCRQSRHSWALEGRGIDSAAAAKLAEALRSRLAGRTRKELEALMDGVELGCQVQRAIGQAKPIPDSNEMDRLFEDFVVELKKLDEGLRALAAFANRLRRTTGDESKTFH